MKRLRFATAIVRMLEVGGVVSGAMELREVILIR